MVEPRLLRIDLIDGAHQGKRVEVPYPQPPRITIGEPPEVYSLRWGDGGDWPCYWFRRAALKTEVCDRFPLHEDSPCHSQHPDNA